MLGPTQLLIQDPNLGGSVTSRKDGTEVESEQEVPTRTQRHQNAPARLSTSTLTSADGDPLT